MEQELYSYDRYGDFAIYIIEDNGMYYGDVYFNGTCYKSNIKSNTPEGCLTKCELWCDENDEDE